MANQSRFGPVVQRYCLCVVYYVWAYSFSEFERDARISNLSSSLRRDLLGAVKPFISEISAALDDPACSIQEQRMLEDFAETYEAILDYSQIPFERVEPTWDLYQIPHDGRLNRALFGVLKGLDHLHFQEPEEAARVLLPAWSKLLQIEKRRALPTPLRQLLQENEEEVGRFEAEYRASPSSAPPPEEEPNSFLPSVEDLILARKQGHNLALEKLMQAEPAPSPQLSTGLVIDLEGQSEVSGPAKLKPLLPERPPEPEATATAPGLDSFVEAPAQIEPSTEDLLGIALQGYRPLPSAEEAGKAMLKSHKPADPGTLPPVHGTENPWEEISEEPHVLLNETEPGQNTLGEVRNLFSNLGEAADQERSQATWSDPDAAPKEAKQHGELAALFDED